MNDLGIGTFILAGISATPVVHEFIHIWLNKRKVKTIDELRNSVPHWRRVQNSNGSGTQKIIWKIICSGVFPILECEFEDFIVWKHGFSLGYCMPQFKPEFKYEDYFELKIVGSLPDPGSPEAIIYPYSSDNGSKYDNINREADSYEKFYSQYKDNKIINFSI